MCRRLDFDRDGLDRNHALRCTSPCRHPSRNHLLHASGKELWICESLCWTYDPARESSVSVLYKTQAGRIGGCGRGRVNGSHSMDGRFWIRRRDTTATSTAR